MGVSHPENKITDFKNKHTDYDSIFVRIQINDIIMIISRKCIKLCSMHANNVS